MPFYTEVQFVQLTADNDGVPFALLKEVAGSRDIKIAINGYDANRLAISAFKILNIPMQDLSLSLIEKLGGEVKSIELTSQNPKFVSCSLTIIDSSQNEQKVNCRPGEGFFIAAEKELPIFVEENVFRGKQVEFSLKKRVRNNQTDQFATFKLN
jgi:bifunctional DNase/RNase